MKSLKRWLVTAAAGILLTGAVVGGLNRWMIGSSAGAIYRASDPAAPARDVAVVLGTVPALRSGNPNLHFTARISAAARLYHSGKVKHLLLSGDNGRRDYDEPTAMKQALLALGVPESAMTLDYAGFRTLDSMARAKQVFGQDRIMIITERFHAARAVFLARHFGVDAVAVCAEDLPAAWTLRSRLREFAARPAAAVDVFVLHRGPRFYGETVPVKISAG
jgi:SanA protein